MVRARLWDAVGVQGLTDILFVVTLHQYRVDHSYVVPESAPLVTVRKASDAPPLHLFRGIFPLDLCARLDERIYILASREVVQYQVCFVGWDRSIQAHLEVVEADSRHW